MINVGHTGLGKKERKSKWGEKKTLPEEYKWQIETTANEESWTGLHRGNGIPYRCSTEQRIQI